MKKFLAFVLLAVSIVSCKKNDDAPAVVIKADTTYIPVIADGVSYWKYNHWSGSDSISASKDSFKLVALTKDSIYSDDGKKYTVYSDNLNPNASKYIYFYRSDKDSNYRRGFFKNNNAGGTIPDIVEKYFVSNLPVGGTWSQDFLVTTSGISVNAKNTYTITSLTDTITIGGTLYSNVAKIHLDMYLNDILSGALTKVGSGESYYSKNIGSVKYFYSLKYLNFLNIYERSELTSFYIKK